MLRTLAVIGAALMASSASSQAELASSPPPGADALCLYPWQVCCLIHLSNCIPLLADLDHDVRKVAQELLDIVGGVCQDEVPDTIC